MLSLDNFTFGTKALDLTGLKSGTPMYAGQAVGTVADTTKASAIDMSQLDGNLKNRYTIRLNLVKEFAGTGFTKLTLTFYYLNAEGAAIANAYTTATFTIPAAELKKAVDTPLEFGLPSFGGYRYIRLGIDTDATAALTSGAVKVYVEPTRL